MSRMRKTVVAGLAASALALGAPLAAAATSGHADRDVHDDAPAVVDAHENQVPVQACNNNVPVNVLGVQAPVHDVAGGVGLVAEDTHATAKDNCDQAADQQND